MPIDDARHRVKRPTLVAAAPGDARCELSTKQIPRARSAEWVATSLFSGGGGFDLGFLQEGIGGRTAYDLSKSALATYSANLPASGRLADLARISPDDQCDVLLAGAPCQGFSNAGNHRIDDPRNALLGRIGDIALRTRPRAVVVENVPAALSGKHGRLWRNLEDRFRLDGYNTTTLTLLGEESGVAQRRRRIFMLCWLGCNETRIELAVALAPTLRSVLAGVESNTGHRPSLPAPGSVDARVARHIGPGQKLCNVRTSANAVPTWCIPEVFGQTSPAERVALEAITRLRRRDRRRNHGDGDPVSRARLKAYLDRDIDADVARLLQAGYLREIEGDLELKHTYNGKYRRLNWKDLSPTVDTHFGRTSMFMHPDEDRGLSAREAARIQGFPDAFVLTGRTRDQFETIGNAVPPPMAARIARFVREAILKR